jgi:hypothetical protein
MNGEPFIGSANARLKAGPATFSRVSGEAAAATNAPSQRAAAARIIQPRAQQALSLTPELTPLKKKKNLLLFSLTLRAFQ